jgi:HEAT repeat protein
LFAALKDQDQLVRWEATRALGCIWQFPDLVGLGDTDTEIRRVAAKALGRIWDARAIEPLIAALRDRDHRVRECAADALGAFGAMAIEPLASLLSYKDREIRRSIGRAFARISDGKVIEILASAVQDHRWWVREAAADALTKLGNRAVPTLAIALENDDPNVRQLAQFALRRIGTVKSQATLRFRKRR